MPLGLSKYWITTKISWTNGFVYRLNFIMWRLRVIIRILALYFLWLAIFRHNSQVFSYQISPLLTYILGISIMSSLIISSRSTDAQSEIATGDLNNYLVKPLNYFIYWLFRDFADKALNLIFSIVELTVLFLILKPPIFLQQNFLILSQFLLASMIALIMFFYFSMIISLSTFWWTEQNGWPQRFLSMVIIEFLAGSLFPLDILPLPLFNVLKFLPTNYFLFFPLQIYLGRISPTSIWQGISIMIIWTLILWAVAQALWSRGTKIYGAYGR